MVITTITEQQAKQALAAVKEQFRTYLEPIEFNEDTLPPTCSEPTLVMDYDGHPAICWEDGPSEWAFLVNHGDTSEEGRVLVAQAAKEFGVEYQEPKGVEPAVMPKSVYAEAIMSCVLGLYPA